MASGDIAGTTATVVVDDNCTFTLDESGITYCIAPPGTITLSGISTPAG